MFCCFGVVALIFNMIHHFWRIYIKVIIQIPDIDKTFGTWYTAFRWFERDARGAREDAGIPVKLRLSAVASGRGCVEDAGEPGHNADDLGHNAGEPGHDEKMRGMPGFRWEVALHEFQECAQTNRDVVSHIKRTKWICESERKISNERASRVDCSRREGVSPLYWMSKL